MTRWAAACLAPPTAVFRLARRPAPAEAPSTRIVDEAQRTVVCLLDSDHEAHTIGPAARKGAFVYFAGIRSIWRQPSSGPTYLDDPTLERDHAVRVGRVGDGQPMPGCDACPWPSTDSEAHARIVIADPNGSQPSARQRESSNSLSDRRRSGRGPLATKSATKTGCPPVRSWRPGIPRGASSASVRARAGSSGPGAATVRCARAGSAHNVGELGRIVDA